jgi:DNA-binding beta-propeller fold protein YncE
MKLTHLLFGIVLACLLMVPFSSSVHADGGAPNLAYIAGASHGIDIIDVAQQRVTGSLSVPGDPHAILLSLDARFLYVTQPQEGRVAVLAAKTGQTICTANVPGQPTLLAYDPNPDTLYAAGNGAASVTALNPNTCAVKFTISTDGPVYGLAVVFVAGGLAGHDVNELWVAARSLSVFNDLNGQVLTTVAIPDEPRYICIPPGATVYVTTARGSVLAVDLNTRHVIPLVSGGVYGPMDYDATTGEMYVPDAKNKQLVILAPVNSGFPPPHEPGRIIHLGVVPASVAITSDGQLGFVALASGNVAMLDIPARQLITTIPVGGSPHFIITGLYPPLVGTTPQQASIWGTVINIAAYVFVIALFLIPLLLFRRYAKGSRTQNK